MSLATSGQRASPSPVANLGARSRPGELPPIFQSLFATITGIAAAVEEETAALKARRHVDLDAFSNRKSQGLMELNRVLRLLGPAAKHEAVAERLSGLREKLELNQAVLKMHLDAVREVSQIVANAIREAESDGTYSHTIRSPEHRYEHD